MIYDILYIIYVFMEKALARLALARWRAAARRARKEVAAHLW